jgi:hypothetical protein
MAEQEHQAISYKQQAKSVKRSIKPQASSNKQKTGFREQCLPPAACS